GLATLDVANYNSQTQTVLAGPRADITAAAPIFTAAGARYVPLSVSAAFHSRYMDEAERQFTAFLAGVTFAPPRVPVIANVTGGPYPHEGGEIRQTLLRQMRSPVRWYETISYLLAQPDPVVIQEVGPGKVLTRLVDEIKKEPLRVAPETDCAIAVPAPAPRPREGLIFLCPGHGSQYLRMGSALYRHDPRFRHELDRCSEIASPLLGCSLTALIEQGGPDDPDLERAPYAISALFAVSHALMQALAVRGPEPAVLLGYGTGTFAAAVAAGAMSLRDGITLSIAFARTIEDKTERVALLA